MMQNPVRKSWRGKSIAFFMVLLLATVVISLNVSVTPVLAQPGRGTPTPTPTDPLWLAFSAAREAIEEERSIDLTYVTKWDWWQDQYQFGIDDCLDAVMQENPASARPIFIGWTFQITGFNNVVYEARVSYNLEIVVVCDRLSTAAVPTVAAGTPNPNLPPPVAGAAAGGSFELGGHVLELSANTVSLMQRSGMTWVKKQLRYTPGMDTSTAQSYLTQARANNFKLILGIVGRPEDMGNYAQYIQDFAGYLGRVAALGVDAIEVWNEPNIVREWPANSINGGTYTQMLAASFNAIKTARAQTIVISGAPSPTGYFGAAGCAVNSPTDAGCNDDTFMQQMAAAGAAQYLDCVGLHYNEGIIAPSATTGDPRGTYPTYYFQSMLARGYSPFGGKPVCFTELGYLSGEGFSTPIPAGFAWAANTTVAQHAAWLAEAATLASQSGRVRLMIVWNVDFPFYTASDPMGGYAIFRPNGSCPACDTLGTVMRR